MLPRMLNLTPDPIAFQLGPIPVYWYGIGYALGLLAAEMDRLEDENEVKPVLKIKNRRRA